MVGYIITLIFITVLISACIVEAITCELNPIPKMDDTDDEKVIFRNITKTRKLYEGQKR